MARTYMNVELRQSAQATDEAVRKVLIADDYREINYNREVVWKKGTGMMTAMHYIKLEYKGNMLCVSGWVQIGVGSVGGKEHDLSGVMGSVPKKSVLKTMDKIKNTVEGMPASYGSSSGTKQEVNNSNEKMIKFCQCCGAKLRLPNIKGRLKVTCPTCKKVFFINNSK